MEQVVGPRDGEAGADSRLFHRRQDRHRVEARSNGHYSHSENNASFVGFLPSRRPALAIIVVIDSPHGEHGRTADRSSAPIWKRIAQPALQYLGVGPDVDAAAPVLVARSDEPCRRRWTATCRGRPARPPETATRLRRPSAWSRTDRRNGSRSARTERARRDSPAREARPERALSGDGFVVSQDPAAGRAARGGTVCRLVLDRKSQQQQRR